MINICFESSFIIDKGKMYEVKRHFPIRFIYFVTKKMNPVDSQAMCSQTM